MRLLFIGPPGAGKGTQAAKVAAHLRVPHISTGDMFRSHVARGTELGVAVNAIMEAGGYVPDELTTAMLSERIEEPDAAGGFILDGFPRTLPQVDALDETLGSHGLDMVIVFEVDEEELVERLASRGRPDDSEETIRHRRRVYLEQTEPLIELYEDRGLVRRVDGIGDPDVVAKRILEAIES